jgi:hypothetical protein
MYNQYPTQYPTEYPMYSSSTSLNLATSSTTPSSSSSESLLSYSGNSYATYQNYNNESAFVYHNQPQYQNYQFNNIYSQQREQQQSYPIQQYSTVTIQNFIDYQPIRSPTNFQNTPNSVYTSTPIQNYNSFYQNYNNYSNNSYENNVDLPINSNQFNNFYNQNNIPSYQPVQVSAKQPEIKTKVKVDKEKIKTEQEAVVGQKSNKRRAVIIERLDKPMELGKSCPICKVTFNTIAEMIIHKSIFHDDNDSKVCPVCGKFTFFFKLFYDKLFNVFFFFLTRQKTRKCK